MKIKGTLSEKKQLTTGIPQRSCLDPALFTIYVANLFQIIERHFPEAQGYADDHHVYLSFRPILSTNQTDLITAIENCGAELRSWMISNMLMVCNIPAPTTPRVFETGLITHSESQASTLTNSTKGSDPLAEKLAGRLDCHRSMTARRNSRF